MVNSENFPTCGIIQSDTTASLSSSRQGMRLEMYLLHNQYKAIEHGKDYTTTPNTNMKNNHSQGGIWCVHFSSNLPSALPHIEY